MANCNGWRSRWSREAARYLLSTRSGRTRSARNMPTIRHSISIDASPEEIFPFFSSGKGFSQWWAADVTEDVPRNIVTLGFFNRATVYNLHPVRIMEPTVAEWVGQSGRRMERHGAAIRSVATKRRPRPAAVFSHGLARRDGLLRRLHNHLGRTDVPIESSRRRQDSRTAFLCHGNGLLKGDGIRLARITGGSFVYLRVLRG
jgi:hypothetical protein